MRKIITIGLVLAFVGFLMPVFIPQPVCAMTGSGTEEDPYMIYDVDDLQDMNLGLTAYYELANDIDASATVGWNGGAGFEPVGIDINPFAGSLDGNGCTISDLYINRPGTSYVGLFGNIDSYDYLYPHWVIQNIRFVDPDITGLNHVGVLAGAADTTWCSGGTDKSIFNINVEGGDVSGGGGNTGGLVGRINVGHNNPCRVCVSYCWYEGEVYGQNGVGGLVGTMGGCDGVDPARGCLYRCGTSISITVGSSGTRVGGLAGYSCGNITECCSYGYVEGHPGGYEGAGGLVGRGGGIIKDCYSRCAVQGLGVGTYGEYVGGLDGRSDLDTLVVDNCYCTGAVWNGKYMGGMYPVGVYGGTWTDCFWDIQTSGWATSGRGTGKTTAEMKTESTFTGAGWDFDDIWSINPSINDGYPYLLWYYDPFPWDDYDTYQVLWFQPNDLIYGTTLPDRAGTEDGVITWGANPGGITISHGELIPEEEYDFEPIIPGGRDIIKPEPEIMAGGVDLERLHDNPLYPLVQILSIDGFLNERLAWLGIAWFITLVAMLGVHLGFDTRKGSEKPQHFVLTTITGLGLSIIFYTMGIFDLWVIIMMGILLGGAVIWERQPVI